MKKTVFALTALFAAFTLNASANSLPININKILPSKSMKENCDGKPEDFKMFFKNSLQGAQVSKASLKLEYVVSGQSYVDNIPLTSMYADYGDEIFTVYGNAACAANNGLSSLKVSLVQLDTTGGNITKPTLKPTSKCMLSATSISPMTVEKDVNKWTVDNYICN